MLRLGPCEMMYLCGSKVASGKKQIIIRDFQKRWAVKKSICTKGAKSTGFDMESQYEIIGEFDLWSEAMECRNKAFAELPPRTFVAIDDPQATHWTISGEQNPAMIPQEIHKGAQFVKLWCVINQDEIEEKENHIGSLEKEALSMINGVSSMKKKFEEEKDSNKKLMIKMNIESLKAKYQAKRLEMEKKRWLITPSTPVKEIQDWQPGYEVDYVYHPDNTFVPNGMVVGNGYIEHKVNLSGILPVSLNQIKDQIKNEI